MTTIKKYFKKMRATLGERHELEVAGGQISANGFRAIQDFLYRARLCELPHDFDRDWTVTNKASAYRGVFPKRAAQCLLKTHGLKLGADVRTKLGNLASQHRDDSDRVYRFSYHDAMDWEPGDYGDDGSCFWGCRKDARSVLNDFGMLFVKFYEPNGYGMGRAIIDDRPDKHAVVWNGYGLQTLDAARIISLHAGEQSFSRIDLSQNGDAGGLVYINSGTGYAVGDMRDIRSVEGRDFKFPIEECYDCYKRLDNSMVKSYTNGHNGRTVCSVCYHKDYGVCDDCKDFYRSGSMSNINGKTYCKECVSNHGAMCYCCGCYCSKKEVKKHNGNDHCGNCYDNIWRNCRDCGERHERIDMRNIRWNDYVCLECFKGYARCDSCFTMTKKCNVFVRSDSTTITGCTACSENLQANGVGGAANPEPVAPVPEQPVFCTVLNFQEDLLSPARQGNWIRTQTTATYQRTANNPEREDTQ